MENQNITDNAPLPNKRGRKPLTDEQKEIRNQEKKQYYKQYYQDNKQKVNKINNECWKKRLKFLRELGNDKRVLEFYKKLKEQDKDVSYETVVSATIHQLND